MEARAHPRRPVPGRRVARRRGAALRARLRHACSSCPTTACSSSATRSPSATRSTPPRGSDQLDGPAHDIGNAVPYLFDEAALRRAAEPGSSGSPARRRRRAPPDWAEIADTPAGGHRCNAGRHHDDGRHPLERRARRSSSPSLALLLVPQAVGRPAVAKLLLGISGDPARFQSQTGQASAVRSFFLGWQQGQTWGTTFPKMLERMGPIPMFHIGTQGASTSRMRSRRSGIASGAGDGYLSRSTRACPRSAASSTGGFWPR